MADKKKSDETAETVPAGNTEAWTDPKCGCLRSPDVARDVPCPDHPETAATPEFDKSTLDEFGQQFLTRTASQIEKLNSVTTSLKSMSTDVNEITSAAHDLLKNATLPDGMEHAHITPEVLAEYDAIVKREVEIDMIFRQAAAEYAANKATQGQDAEKITALETERAALDKKVKNAKSLLSTEYPGAETLLPDVIRLSGTSGGSGKGSGGRKLRGFTVSVDGNVAYLGKDDAKKSSFAAGASVLSIPTPDLQRAYFEKVGTDDVEKLPQTPVEFTVKGADGKEHTVTAQKNAE